MALVSPGVEITIIDESQYLPSALATIPMVVIATNENKTINGVIAPGTIKANAGRVYGISSQRELASTFGVPVFRRSAADTPLHGDELNEYGLMAAYSALGLGNRAWVVRADVDLNALIGSSIRPVGAIVNNSNWLDTSLTKWGLFEFTNTVAVPGVPFVEKKPLIIDTQDAYGATLVNNANPPVPVSSVGSIGDYAVVLGSDNILFYKKLRDNTWTGLGTSTWANDIAAATGSKTETASGVTSTPIALGTEFTVNGNVVTSTATINSYSDFVADFGNALVLANVSGVTVSSVNNYIEFNVTAAVGTIVLTDGPQNVLSKIGIFPEPPAAPANLSAFGTTVTETSLGITWTWTNAATDYWQSSAVTFRRAAVHSGNFNTVPTWRKNASTRRPDGSIWLKTSIEGGGANFVYKRYNSFTRVWNTLSAPIYNDGILAINGLDSAGSGMNLAAGSIFVRANPRPDATNHAGYKIFTQRLRGETRITGTVANPTFNAVHNFTIQTSQPGSDVLATSPIISVGGTNAAAFVAAVTAANIPNLTALVESSGTITLVHRTGGIIALNPGTGSAINDAGFINPSTGVTGTIGATLGLVNATAAQNAVVLSNFSAVAYQYSSTEPYATPADGAYWYYDDATEVDIMINDLHPVTGLPAWRGYRNVSSDARGYNLSMTNANGVFVTASEPKFQSDGVTDLKDGELWLDTSDLVNYPKLYRYNAANRLWVLIDNSDRVSQNGILFADARWDTTGTIDPIKGSLVSTKTMLSNDRVDLDAPNPKLYARGTLLFNTRRSGFTVKKFVLNYFNADAYPGQTLPTMRNTWVSTIAYDEFSRPYMGPRAQRNEVVKAMKAAVDSSTFLREDVYNYNLLAAPGYPELIPNLIALNNDRANTGFIIGDTSFSLRPNSADFINYSNNYLANSNPYLAVYYPSALTNDLNGNEIAVPPSHMMLRTYMYNDQVAYQWFAPAGTRRGLIDNANAIGYVNSRTGLFVRTSLNNNLRDTLYENRMNPITLLPTTGIVAYGQKTRAASTTSMDRVNVARLVNYLRSIFVGVGNQFMFEPNDKITRDQVKAAVEGILSDLVAKRGVYDYIVVCDETNNTSDRIARNELYVDVAVEPVRAVEFIYIPIRLKNPGTIAGTANTAETA